VKKSTEEKREEGEREKRRKEGEKKGGEEYKRASRLPAGARARTAEGKETRQRRATGGVRRRERRDRHYLGKLCQSYLRPENGKKKGDRRQKERERERERWR